MDARSNGRTDGRSNARTDGRTDGRTHGRTVGRTVERTEDAGMYNYTTKTEPPQSTAAITCLYQDHWLCDKTLSWYCLCE